MTKYKNRRYRYVTNVEDFNKILKFAEDNTELKLFKANDKSQLKLKDYSYIDDAQRYVEITTAYCEDFKNNDGTSYYDLSFGYPCTWIFDKTGENKTVIHPSIVSKMSRKVYVPYNIVKERPDLFSKDFTGRIIESGRPILGYSKKFDNKENFCYAYDLNSAYASVLIDKIIDTYNFRENDVIGENEVGFLLDDYLTLVDTVGAQCDIVFPLIDSPFKDYVTKWYNIKKNSPKGSKEKNIAKNILVITVGLWQANNPFLRAYVVNSCNKKIQNIIDNNKDDVMMWNTDAVYSNKPLDLEIGDEIGQFKLEYVGRLRQKKNNYQKVDVGETSYRGQIKSAFSSSFNILTDELPEANLPFVYDEETNKIMEIDYEEK